MAVPITTLEDLFAQDAQMLERAPQKYGAHFGHACEATALLSMFVKSVSHDREIFMRYMSHVKKHHTLALMSTARLHQIQAMMNLRIVLESAANAAYALCNPAVENFLIGAPGTPAKKTEVILDKSYKWLAATLPDYSEAVKAVKGRINETTAHSNIVYTQSTFKFDAATDEVASTTFFDIEDPYFVKTDLWQIANAAVGVIGMIAAASEIGGGLVLADNFTERMPWLMAENERLKAEFMEGERYKAAAALIAQGAK
jgi:hypothetical protein